jgi:hypothetical protein
LEVFMVRCLLVLAVLLACAAPASATPRPSFTVTQTAARSFTFDASATVCEFGFCGYSWRGYGTTSNRLGFTIGSGQVVAYTFPAGTFSVVLTFSQRCFPGSARWCPAYASAQVDAR